MRIRQTEFGGVMPRIHARKLPPSGAQIALNMDMGASTLKPMRGPGDAEYTQGEPIETLYRYYVPDTPETREAGIDPETHNAWFTWPFLVDVAKGQLAADAYGWVFFTGDSDRGDYLKATNAFLDVHNFFDQRAERPRSSVNFFIPRPENPLSLEVVSPEGVEVDSEVTLETRVYTYTRVWKSILGYTIESPPAPVSEFIDVPAMEVAAEGEDGVLETVPAWVRVTGFTTYDGADPYDIYNLATHTTDLENGVSGFNLGWLRYRFYRSVGGQYILVHEQSLGIPDEAESYVEFIDSVRETRTLDVVDLESDRDNEEIVRPAESLSFPLASMDWDNPPSGMRGLVNMPNGIMAGFKTYDVFFCEPYRPHAWPRKYSLTVDTEIVGLEVMDTTLVILTKGTPYFAQGAHPDSMTLVRSPMTYPCASKASIVGFDNAVYYASYDGLIRLTSSGGENLTRELISPEVWATRYQPERLQAYAHRTQYVAFWGTSSSPATLDPDEWGQGFVLDTISGRMGFHRLFAGGIDHGVSAGHRDSGTGILHFAGVDGAASYVARWDATEDNAAPLNWESKEYELAFPAGFGWGQVYASQYPVKMTFLVDDDAVMFPDPSNPDSTVDYWEVESPLPFRLPVRHGRTWGFRVRDYLGEVFSITLAQSSAELKAE